MTVSEIIIQQFASEGSPIYLPKLGSTFLREKPFVLKTMFFSHLASTCLRESVGARQVGKGELHSHPYHVGIQVESCIFLNAFMLNHCMCT